MYTRILIFITITLLISYFIANNAEGNLLHCTDMLNIWFLKVDWDKNQIVSHELQHHSSIIFILKYKSMKVRIIDCIVSIQDRIDSCRLTLNPSFENYRHSCGCKYMQKLHILHPRRFNKYLSIQVLKVLHTALITCMNIVDKISIPTYYSHSCNFR